MPWSCASALLLALVLGLAPWSAPRASDPRTQAGAALAIADATGALLDTLMVAARIDQSPVAEPEPPQEPRHVLFRSRDLLREINLLRRFHELDPVALPPLPAGQATMDDVAGSLRVALSAVEALLPAFGDPPRPTAVAARASATPADVTRSIEQSRARLSALGVPNPSPNAVFAALQVSRTLLDAVLDAEGALPASPAAAEPATSRDVVAEIGRLGTAVREAGLRRPRLALPGVTATIHPLGLATADRYMLRAASDLEADLRAIALQIGLDAASERADVAGRTPSDNVRLAAQMRLGVEAMP